ncbi:hypothetical protein ACPFP2_05840 [Micromonospora citrea]|uniref:hypothetical protein n=1 Tax=Micromonospora citrea TaxID=47855 RepID=UPI003C584243
MGVGGNAEGQHEASERGPGGDNFLLGHPPSWTIVGRTPFDNPVSIDQDLEAAVAMTTSGMRDPRIDLVLSGHVHLHEMRDFGATTLTRRPPQLTVGASGTALDQKTRQDSAMIGRPVDGVPVGHLVTVQEFGYAVLRGTGTTWNLRFLNQFGTLAPSTNCDLVGAQFPNCV